MVVGDAAVLIGRDVDVGPHINLIKGTHQPFGISEKAAEKAAGKDYSLPITIEDGAWIGAGATILGGVTLGKQSLIAAGALVRKSVDSAQIVAGVPTFSIAKKEYEKA